MRRRRRAGTVQVEVSAELLEQLDARRGWSPPVQVEILEVATAGWGVGRFGIVELFGRVRVRDRRFMMVARALRPLAYHVNMPGPYIPPPGGGRLVLDPADVEVEYITPP